MQPVFADPKTDFVFKRIFVADARKPLLIALLNHLLELSGEREIRSLQHLPLEQHVDVSELKLSLVDVKCTDATGRRFVVEMQVLKVEGFEKRVVYNASKAYVMQLRSAEEYPTLCDVVGVTICNFKLWPEQDATGHFLVPMLSRWRMQEQHAGAGGLGQVQYAFLELPKYAAGTAPESLSDRWAYFFREAMNLDGVPQALSHEPFVGALEVARTATFTPGEWDAYERGKMAEQDARGAITVAIQEGEARGLVRGKAEGDVAGRAAAVLLFLEARGLAISAEQRQAIAECTDAARLGLWISRAATVASTADLLA